MLPMLLTIGPVKIYSMGVAMVVAVLLGMFLVWKKGRDANLEEREIFDVMFVGLFWALVGARVGYVIGHYSEFGFSLLNWVWLSNYPGLSFWEGFVVGMVAIWLRVKGGEEDVLTWFDYISLGLSLGIGVGSIGMFLNGSYLGVETDSIFGLAFAGWEARMVPIQLIVAVLFIGFSVWWWKMEGEYRTLEWYRAGKVTAKSGFLWFGFMIFLGLVMTVTGLLRRDPLVVAGVNIELLWSAVALVIGLVGLYARSGRRLGDDLRLKSWKTRRRSIKSSKLDGNAVKSNL